MIKRLLSLILLTISLNAGATHYLEYYVYVEMEYVQGPWSRTSILDETNYKFLAPKWCDGSFGSNRTEMVSAMIGNLRENKPNAYSWDSEITIDGDTVVLLINDRINSYELVKNELIATLVLNNFSAVRFITSELDETCTLENLTLPHLDLVWDKTETPSLPTEKEEISAEVQPKVTNEVKTIVAKNSTWLPISIGLNILLLLVLIVWRFFAKKKS